MKGTRLDDRYVLGESLGAGGQGEVFLARDTKLGKDVAVKLLLEESQHPADLARLRREAQVLAEIEHPNVVLILDVGANYVVMQRLTGPSLGHLAFELAPFPVEKTVRYGLAIAGALVVLHTRAEPIIHRDLKPGNVLLDGDPETGTVKLCDFGLARKPLGGLTLVTQSGVLVGTPGYMSPEQLQGLEPAPPMDVYALGATLFMVLTGQPPFRWDNRPGHFIQQVCTQEPPSMLSLRSDVPPVLDDLVHQMLATEPADRPDAAHVRDKLADLAGTARADEEVARLTEQFAEVESLFAAGKTTRAAYALVRMLGRAQATLGPDHPLVRRMNAYAETMRTR